MKRKRDGWREGGREGGRHEEQREGHRTKGERESKTRYSTLNKQLTHNKEIISVDGVVNCHF